MGYKKLTRKQWKRKYYYLCAKATKLFKEYNPCKINKAGRCTDCRKGNSLRFTSGDMKNCCGQCRYNKNGCTIKNLSCKVFLCSNMADEYPELNKELRKIRKVVSEELGLSGIFFQDINTVLERVISWRNFELKGD